MISNTTVPEYLRIEPVSNRRQRRNVELVPTIEILLYGTLADLTEPEQAALKDGVIGRLQAGSDACGHGPFDRSYIVVELSGESPIHARVYFKAGSGVDISEAEDIGDFIQSDESAVALDGSGTEYDIVGVYVRLAEPPMLAPTLNPSPAQTPNRPRHVDGNILVRVRFDNPVLQQRLASLACVAWTVTFRGFALEGRATASGTLCPTAAPTSSSPTADPTGSPSTAPALRVTMAPTTAPSQQPTLIRTAVRLRDIAKSHEESSAAEGSVTRSIAAIVGALLVLIGMSLYWTIVNRRKRQPMEGAEAARVDDFSAAAALELRNISAGIEVVVPAAATSAGDRLWSDFRRGISFDILYYDNPIMKLDDLGLHDVYALLEMSCPPGAYLDHLRTVGGRWLNLPFSESNEGDLVDDAVDLFMAAMPDCLVERAIDLIALSKLQEVTEDTDALYAMIDEVFSSGPNKFLVRDKSGNAHMSPGAANREVHCPESEYFESDGAEAVHIRHCFGAVDLFAETPFANAPAAMEYDLVSGEADGSPSYCHSYNVAASSPEDTYATALGVEEEEITYSLAGSGKPPRASKARPNGSRCLSLSTEDTNDSLGSATKESSFGLVRYSLGSMGLPESTDDTYATADAVGAGTGESTGGGITYSLGSFGATESTADMDDDVTYSLARGIGGGGQLFKSADRRGAVEAVYEIGNYSNLEGDPAAGETGRSDQMTHSVAGHRKPPKTDRTAVPGSIKFTSGRTYIDCTLSGDKQPGSLSVNYMECLSDERDSSLATPETVAKSVDATSPKSTGVPTSRWMVLGKWLKGNDKPKKPSAAPFYLNENFMTADDGSDRIRKPMKRSVSTSSLDV